MARNNNTALTQDQWTLIESTAGSASRITDLQVRASKELQVAAVTWLKHEIANSTLAKPAHEYLMSVFTFATQAKALTYKQAAGVLSFALNIHRRQVKDQRIEDMARASELEYRQDTKKAADKALNELEKKGSMRAQLKAPRREVDAEKRRAKATQRQKLAKTMLEEARRKAQA